MNTRNFSVDGCGCAIVLLVLAVAVVLAEPSVVAIIHSLRGCVRA